MSDYPGGFTYRPIADTWPGERTPSGRRRYSPFQASWSATSDLLHREPGGQPRELGPAAGGHDGAAGALGRRGGCVMGSRSRQRPQQRDFMAEANAKIEGLMNALLDRLRAEYERMVCPKCGRGIMKPTHVERCEDVRCWVRLATREHLHEVCTMCEFWRAEPVKSDA